MTQLLMVPKHSTEKISTSGHLDFLDGLRGLAAMYVVLHHARIQAWTIVNVPFARSHTVDLLTGWMDYGHFAVTIFITISGFSLMIPVLRTGTLRGGARGFLIGRARRILPPYYGALVLSIGIALWFRHVPTQLFFASGPMTLRGVLTHIFLLHDIFGTTAAQLNPPMWSIAVETHIYLFFPLIVWIWKKIGIARTLAILGVVAFPLCVLVHGTNQAMMSPQYLFIFGLGMLANIQAFGKKDSAPADSRCLGYKVVGLLAIVAFLLSEHFDVLSNLYLQDLLIGVAGCCLLVIVTRDKNSFARRIASLKPIVWVGGFSYSLYLLHFPLQEVLWQATAGHYHLSQSVGFLILLLGTALIIPFCFFFYQVLEKPFMRSKPKA